MNQETHIVLSNLIKEDISVLEESLLKGLIKNNPKSQEVLYKRFFGYGMSICLRYAGNRDEASEVLNESFLKVFKNIKKYKKEHSFKSWMRKIVVNTAIDFYRSQKKFQQNVEIAEAHAQEYDLNIIDKLTVDDILTLLHELPEHYRITFSLYEIEGYSHDEIGKKLNVSESTSRSNLTRAKKKLRDLVIKRFNGEYEGSI